MPTLSHCQGVGIYKCQFFVHSNYLGINLEGNTTVVQFYFSISTLAINLYGNWLWLLYIFGIKMIGSPGIVFWRATNWRELIHGPNPP